MSVNALRVRRVLLGCTVAAFSLGVIGSSATAVVASASHSTTHTMIAAHRYGD